MNGEPPSTMPALVRRKLRRASHESASTKFTMGGRQRATPKRVPSLRDYSKPQEPKVSPV